MTVVVDLQGVTLVRSRAVILEDITWRLSAGQHWAILGPNGAGKTSLLRIMAGREYPSTGRATLLEERLGKAEVADLHARIGFTSASLEGRINPEQTVLDVVLSAAYGKLARWNEAYEEADISRAQDVLSAFGVGALARRRLETLSEGERQRVLIARALMSDPELLLLDEPAAGLDLGGREELLAALSELAAYPASPVLVLVTHHVEEIPVGFTHVMLLKDGKLAAAGPIDEVLTSQTLSEVFGIPLQVAKRGQRWAAMAQEGT